VFVLTLRATSVTSYISSIVAYALVLFYAIQRFIVRRNDASFISHKFIQGAY
jgi:hypothetical protein